MPELFFPVLRSRNLHSFEKSGGVLPQEPFLVYPRDYYVNDGDTISVKSQDGDRAFSVRFRSISASETTRTKGMNAALSAILGTELYQNGGDLSKRFLQFVVKSKPLLVFPERDNNGKSMKDRYGRLLGDVYVAEVMSYGSVNSDRSSSLERIMFNNKRARANQNEQLPAENVTQAVMSYTNAGPSFNP